MCLEADIKCLNGCVERVLRKDLSYHLKYECSNRKVKCIYEKIGCNWYGSYSVYKIEHSKYCNFTTANTIIQKHIKDASTLKTELSKSDQEVAKLRGIIYDIRREILKHQQNLDYLQRENYNLRIALYIIVACVLFYFLRSLFR